MTVSKVRADYEQLTEIARIFGQQAESAQRLLGALQQDMTTLQGGDWVGKGADRLYAEMTSAVLPAMGRVVRAMSEAASATTKISQVMKQAEDQSAALFRLDDTPGHAAGAAPGPASAFASPPTSGSNAAGSAAPAAPRSAPASNRAPVIPGDQGGDGVHPNDVIQVGLNCYLMAGLAALATTEAGRKKIEQMIRPNPDGTYTVTFRERKTGEEIFRERWSEFPPKKDVDPYKNREVTVTADFPRGSARSEETGEIWVPLIEKAYGQAYEPNGWGHGYVGKAMERITGVPDQLVSPDRVTVAALADHLAKGHAVAVTTPTDKDMTVWGRRFDLPDITDVHPAYTSRKLVTWHVYYVTGVDVATNTVILRNPWGWNGGQTVNVSIAEFQQVFAGVSINTVK